MNNTSTAVPKQDGGAVDRFYMAAWRWHFYAGLYVAPFMIMLAVTGLTIMYIAFFDGRDGEKITVPISGEPQLISSQAQAASNAFSSEVALIEWIGPSSSSGVSVFRIKSGDTNHMVAVDPYTATVQETWIRRNGWYDFMSDIHGELLIGTLGDRLIEIAAGFAIILVVTGVYLWWPRGTSSVKSAFVPHLKVSGRVLWKNLHKVIGVYCSLVLLIFLLSGLAWAGVWGGQFVQAWSTFPAEKWDNVPLSDKTHASMNHGAIKDVPWGLEQTRMPASGSDAGLDGISTGTPVDVDAVAEFGRLIGYEGRFRIHFPQGETGVWTLSQDTMSNDAEDPTTDRTVHIDQYTGKILADVGFNDYSLAAKSMAVGIAFHEGDLGLWNLIFNTIFCLSIIFLSISGLIMWWLRRPRASAIRLFAPSMPTEMPHWRGAMVVMLFLSLAFPLVGLTLLVVLALDYCILSRISMFRRALA